ncbi:amino acid deaminase [Pluralibacter gergoviae]|uniref:amino acid deaminase n=1 Tax=Pluralibacter gergoviae TaxID=61647 RepID=UPI003EDF62BA
MTELTPADIGHKASAMYQEAGRSNILREDVCLPAVVIKQRALDNNIRWMQSYADACGVLLAPHGKTTMTPAIFRRQAAGGAWAIGVGTAYQAKVAVGAGIPRVIIANQLIGRANMRAVSVLKAHSQAAIYCCVDSLENARRLSDHFSAQDQVMDVLLELGIPGGRCGCRTTAEARALAQSISVLPGLRLAGVEFYEGVIHSGNDEADLAVITPFLTRVLAFVRALLDEKLLSDSEEVLLTGAGSVWYDIVAQRMRDAGLPDNVRFAIRPGCYITHDRGVYQQSQMALRERDALACTLGGDLASALELCAFVQSLPEPGLAIVGFGKRDVAFDTGLPQAVAHYREGIARPFAAGSMTTFDIMDQHAMVRYGEGVSLEVGDILVFSTSHPCITFDKWQKIYLIDDDYNTLEILETRF